MLEPCPQSQILVHRVVKRYLIVCLMVLASVLAETAGADPAGGACVQWDEINLYLVVDHRGSAGSEPRDYAASVVQGLMNKGRLSRAGGIGFPFNYPCGSAACPNYRWGYSVTAGNRGPVLQAIKTTPSGGTLPPPYQGSGLLYSIVEGVSRFNATSASGRRILLVVADPWDSTGFSGLVGRNQWIQKAANALKSSGATTYLVYREPAGGVFSSSAFYLAAQAAGKSMRKATVADAQKLVAEIVALGCKNHQPKAAMTLTPANLALGKPGFTINFDGSPSSDKETSDVKLKFVWTLTKPDKSKLTRTGIKFSETFDDSQLKHGDTWSVVLKVTDANGASDTASKSFKVTGSKPAIKLSGADIDALGKLVLSASPTQDLDGGKLEFRWRVTSSPAKAQYKSNHTWAFDSKNHTLSFVTKEGDIGAWAFECIARDNENQTDTKTISVQVRNKPPKIKLEGKTVVKLGETIKVETKILKDEDGGDLEFTWDVVQTPKDASPTVKAGYWKGTGAVHAGITIPTSKDVKYAGTWIVRLTAKDDDGAANSVSKPHELAVVVDAPAEAVIQGKSQISILDFPFELDGGDSLDPDSPPTSVPNRGHKRLDGKPPQKISAGIVSYLWSVTDVVEDPPSPPLLGRADEVLNVPATGSKLKLQLGDLMPGDWTFQLEVKDQEGNSDWISHLVTVIEPNTRPVAVVGPPARYITDTFGGLGQDIVLSGHGSYDLDELLQPSVTKITPGMGISQYAWQALAPPTGCVVPALPSGKNKHTFTLYKSGTSVSGACQGHWQIGLTVTDNDTPAKTGKDRKTVIIGNCPQPLCIDYPTQANPQQIEFQENTDVVIYYHLDSAHQALQALKFGSFTKLELFHASDLNKPVYTSKDPNVLASDKGGLLVFHWDGYTDWGQRPQEGKYTVRIRLVDHLLAATSSAATESDSIWITVADPEIEGTSDRYVDHAALDAGTSKIALKWKVSGGVKPDELRWRVVDLVSGLQIQEAKLLSGPAGNILWDGKVAGTTVPVGKYQVVLQAYKSGASLGKSDPHDLTIYRLRFETAAGPAPAKPPGVHLYVNSDDDNRNEKSDLTEAASSEDDLLEVKLTVEPKLVGKVTLSSSPASPTFKLWKAAGKVAEVTLPAVFETAKGAVPGKLFLEGQKAGQSGLSLKFDTQDGFSLGPAKMALTAVEVQAVVDKNDSHTITASDPATYHLRIANWTAAYGPAPAFLPRNNADPNNLVERDPSRFYLRIRDASANGNASAPDVINMQLGTLHASGAYDDDLTTVLLTETGNNTGEFGSRSQILTAGDIPTVSDDDFAVHDGAAAPVADDTPGDRTHRTQTNGQIRLQYQPPTAASAKTSAIDKSNIWNIVVT